MLSAARGESAVIASRQRGRGSGRSGGCGLIGRRQPEAAGAWPAARSGGELRVIGDDGPDADRDRVDLARSRCTSCARLARDPATAAISCRDLAVEAGRVFPGHEGTPGPHAMQPGLVAARPRRQPAGRRTSTPAARRTAAPPAIAGFGSSTAKTTRRIPAARSASCTARTAGVSTWLEGDDCGASAGPIAGGSQARRPPRGDRRGRRASLRRRLPPSAARMMQPTTGFGLVVPRPRAARSSARRMAACSAWLLSPGVLTLGGGADAAGRLSGSAAPKTEEPATSTFAPASTHCTAVSSVTPPSTSIHRSSSRSRPSGEQQRWSAAPG